MSQSTTFEKVHRNDIVGKLTLPDRILFRGHANWSNAHNLRTLLTCFGVMLKDFGRFARAQTDRLLSNAEQIAKDAGRPYIYLDNAVTALNGLTKEQYARQIAQRDGVTEGLICVMRALEPSGSFDVRGNRLTKKLELVYRRRSCLHLYFYFFHREFGFMHVRVQSWLPFRVQVYINGREWLCRQLDRHGIGYERYDNALLQIDDLAAAQRLARKFMKRSWPSLLDKLARRVVPFWALMRRRGLAGSYYWVTDQCEIAATDVMFRNRASLRRVLPDLLRHCINSFGAEDALRFLGRKPSGNFRSQATADLKRRPEGFRVKFRMKRNHIKMYDKFSVLRIETTICNPYEFKVLRSAQARNTRSSSRWAPGRRRKRQLKWVPMNKGVANFWRYCDVGASANARYLEGLATATLTRHAVDELDRVCHGRSVNSKRIPRLNPVSRDCTRLFSAVLLGQHLLNGFQNRHVTQALFPTSPRSPDEAKRRRERTSRQLAKLRGHGLIARSPRSRRYRVTARGHRVMSAAIRFRLADFEQALQAA